MPPADWLRGRETLGELVLNEAHLFFAMASAVYLYELQHLRLLVCGHGRVRGREPA